MESEDTTYLVWGSLEGRQTLASEVSLWVEFTAVGDEREASTYPLVGWAANWSLVAAVQC